MRKINFQADFMLASGREPWGEWLAIIERFSRVLADLLSGKIEEFCPQINLSSALAKFVMSTPWLQAKKSWC